MSHWRRMAMEKAKTPDTIAMTQMKVPEDERAAASAFKVIRVIDCGGCCFLTEGTACTAAPGALSSLQRLIMPERDSPLRNHPCRLFPRGFTFSMFLASTRCPC